MTQNKFLYKKILVTGGAGFVGSNFIRYLLQGNRGVQVVNFDALTYCGNLENLKDLESNPNYTFVRGNICDIDVVKMAMDGVDAVVHFAAESHVDHSIRDPLVFTRTNVLGTHVLLEVARKSGVKRFVHISTDEVYGSIQENSFRETDPFNPTSPYAASKAAAELIALGFLRTFNVPLIVIRCSNVFGPRQYPEKLIPLFITNLIEGKKVPLMGDGRHRRSWVYVFDACNAIAFILSHGTVGETYNIPGTTELENIEATRKLLTLLGGVEESIQFVPNRLAHDRRYSVDGSKLFQLGWSSQFTFDVALRETVRWYQDNELWWKRLKG